MQERDLANNKINNSISFKDFNEIINTKLQNCYIKTMVGYGKFNPEFVSDWAWRVFTTPQSRKKNKLGAFLDYAQKDSIDFEGKKVKLYRFGEVGKKKIVFVHGWAGCASDFSYFIPRLIDEGFHLIGFDLPAHGLSEGKQVNATEVAKLLVHLESLEGRFHALIGHSFGGFCSAKAVSEQDIAAKIVTIGTPNKLERIIQLFSKRLNLPPKVEEEFRNKIENLFSIKISDQETGKFLKEADIPSLIVHDVGDKQVGIQSAEEIQESAEHVQFLQTRQLGHNRILRDVDVINSIAEFLK
ncbi:MAG: alpha/beta fold hydrolase [Halobacteriovoraceae bacterium]|nr:alpha/beta fold hydrolase [Halobacteriovoraceae bacterium]MCB9095289.1 alpha/beta fold hydrolase [Halobacteriovoraceae bacterium]